MYGISEVHVGLLFLHMLVHIFLLRHLVTNTFVLTFIHIHAQSGRAE